MKIFSSVDNEMAFNVHKPKTNKPQQQAIGAVLESKNLAPIVAKAKLLLRLEDILQNVLPDNLAMHCHVMNIKDGALIIEADNATHAMQARFSENDLLYAIQEHARIQGIARLDFRIRPVSLKPSTLSSSSHFISTKSKCLIREAAKVITDQELKSALLKLAQ